jgi:DNA polymerase
MNVHPKLFVQRAATSTHVLYRDYETRSTIDLQKTGAWKYASHPNTEVICCAYAIDDDPPEIWIPGTRYHLLSQKRHAIRPV